MSRLYFSENGRVVPTLCEEITIFRRVRKVLSLPSTAAQGRVYLLARAYGDEIPLRMSLNGTEVDPIQPCTPGNTGGTRSRLQRLCSRRGTTRLKYGRILRR